MLLKYIGITTDFITMEKSTKICPICKIEKELSEYRLSKQTKDGYRWGCQPCRIEYDRVARVKRKAANPDKYRTLEADRKLRLKYGITLDQYNSLCEQNNNLCEICNKENTTQDRKKLFVDHNHNTGKMRGLLCDSCNQGLGRFKDNLQILTGAINYLNKYDSE